MSTDLTIMSTDSRDIANADPFEITKRGADTDGEFVRFEATIHPGLDADADVELDHERFLLDNPDEHLHPHQEEIIEVLAGEYAVEREGTEHRLEEGEEITVPKNTAHRHWNPTAKPVRVAHEHHPARDSAAHAEAMWALAQDGETHEKGLPNMLQFAVISNAYPAIAYTTAVPVPVQKAMFAVLAPSAAGGVPGSVFGRRVSRHLEDRWALLRCRMAHSTADILFESAECALCSARRLKPITGR